ncbi:protein kinase [Lotmaria passim]
MSSSSADCVASQSTPRPISGSENTCNDGALISLMQQQQPSSFSAPTMPVPISAPAGVLSADDLPLPSVITADKTNVNGKGGDAAFLCLAKRHAAVEDVDASPTAGGTLAPLSQLASPATPPESAVTRSPPLPASRRSSLSPTSLVCDVAQRLRTAVQQQRHHPLPDSAAVGAVGLHAAPQTARPTSADDGDDGDSGGPFSDSGDTAKVTQAPAPTNSADACLNAPTLTSFPPLPSSAARTASSHRQTSPAVAAMLNVDSHHLKETFNMSSLAQLAFNRSVASITTRPPATASNELVKEKRSGAMYINNYRILKSLGHGSCGKVKLAYDEVESRLVAIKSVRRVDPRKRLGGLTTAQKQYNAFMREVEVMKRLRHRNIVSLYEVIDDPSADKLYLVMQYVDKGVVAKVEVRANSDYVCDPVPPPQLAYYAREMLTGLQYLHRHDVVHRDLKPDNILVSKDGHAYLADFGVAETFDTSYLQRRESIMQQSMAMSVAGSRAGGPQVLGTKGTPLFIAPELWDGAKSYGKPVDMWAMGVTLFTLLVGKLPFRSPEDITDATYTPTVPEEFGEQWRVLLGGLLNRDSSARWTVEKALQYVVTNFVEREIQRSASEPNLSDVLCGSRAAVNSVASAPPTFHDGSTTPPNTLTASTESSSNPTQEAENVKEKTEEVSDDNNKTRKGELSGASHLPSTLRRPFNESARMRMEPVSPGPALHPHAPRQQGGAAPTGDELVDVAFSTISACPAPRDAVCEVKNSPSHPPRVVTAAVAVHGIDTRESGPRSHGLENLILAHFPQQLPQKQPSPQPQQQQQHQRHSSSGESVDCPEMPSFEGSTSDIAPGAASAPRDRGGGDGAETAAMVQLQQPCGTLSASASAYRPFAVRRACRVLAEAQSSTTPEQSRTQAFSESVCCPLSTVEVAHVTLPLTLISTPSTVHSTELVSMTSSHIPSAPVTEENAVVHGSGLSTRLLPPLAPRPFSLSQPLEKEESLMTPVKVNPKTVSPYLTPTPHSGASSTQSKEERDTSLTRLVVPPCSAADSTSTAEMNSSSLTSRALPYTLSSRDTSPKLESREHSFNVTPMDRVGTESSGNAEALPHPWSPVRLPCVNAVAAPMPTTISSCTLVAPAFSAPSALRRMKVAPPSSPTRSLAAYPPLTRANSSVPTGGEQTKGSRSEPLPEA